MSGCVSVSSFLAEHPFNRGKGLQCSSRQSGFIIPLMDLEYAPYYTKEDTVILIREWMCICFELLHLLMAHKKGIRRVAVNSLATLRKVWDRRTFSQSCSGTWACRSCSRISAAR